MATLSSPGLSSGLDVNGIVSKLVALERAPIDQLKTQATTIQSRLSSFGLLQSYTDNLRDAAERLAKPDFWTQTLATSADASAVTATATAGAPQGTYAVEVTQIARAHSIASGAFASSTTPVGSGTLTIEFGTWAANNASFSPDPGKTALTVPVTVPDNSVEAIKSKINAANAGVTASIVRDADGARLVIRSNETGEISAMRVTAVDDDGFPADGAGLSALTFDPPNGTLGRMTQSQPGQNAEATVNGIELRSTTNRFEGALEGVTLTVAKETTGAVDVRVALDINTIKKAIGDMAKAYSELDTYITAQTKYDPATKKAGALQGDSSTLALQNIARQLVRNPSEAGGIATRLSDLGLELQTDGSLKVNDTKLTAALADPAKVATLFTNSDDDPAKRGFAVRIRQQGDLLLASDGPITSRTKGLRESVTRNEREQARLEDRVAQTQARLLKQYSALDVTLSQISAQSASLTQALSALTASTRRTD